MNVSRYSDKGTTQSKGIAARSNEMYVVTPSIKLEGTNASAIHFSRRPQEITLSDSACVSFVSRSFSDKEIEGLGRAINTHAHTTISANPNP